LLVSGHAFVGDRDGAIGRKKKIVTLFCKRLAVDDAIGARTREADHEDGRGGAGQRLVLARGKGQPVDAGGFCVEEQLAERWVDRVAGGWIAGG